MWDKRVGISCGFLLLLGWFSLANGTRLLVMVIAAAVIHELGHLAVLKLAGAEIRGLRIGLCGAVLETNAGSLSYGWELAAVLAGPVTNLLCATLSAAIPSIRCPVWTGVNLALCGFNLLPLRPLDGGRALQAASSWALGPDRGELLTRLMGCAAGLAAFGMIVRTMVSSRGSLWLIPPAVGVLGAAMREGTGNFVK